jgi:hypothetical protein
MSYEAPLYALFSNLLSLQLSSVQILSSNILSLCSSLNVKDHVSHPYRTTSKIIVLYILIFMCLASRREDKSFHNKFVGILGEVLSHYTASHLRRQHRQGLGRGHTNETGNRNATAVSKNCFQPELNTCYWMVQRKLRKRQRNSRKDWETQLSGNGACKSSHNCVAAWFPSGKRH